MSRTDRLVVAGAAALSAVVLAAVGWLAVCAVIGFLHGVQGFVARFDTAVAF